MGLGAEIKVLLSLLVMSQNLSVLLITFLVLIKLNTSTKLVWRALSSNNYSPSSKVISAEIKEGSVQ